VYPEKIAKECEASVKSTQKFTRKKMKCFSNQDYQVQDHIYGKRILLFCVYISVSTRHLREVKHIVNIGHQLMKGEERGWILGRVSLHEIRGTIYCVYTAV
jgi:hypothetical protein